MDPASLPKVEGSPRIGPCVGRVGKFICIGLNYSDHAAESGMPVPPEPILFIKATSAIIGPYDDVIIPRGSEKTDWEVELGVVIGTEARYVAEADALNHVAGYCVVNDVSERAFQIERGGQWTKGKSADTFGPIGPWLVTRDEVPDPQDLHMWLEVDGKRWQDGSTKTMIFGVGISCQLCQPVHEPAAGRRDLDRHPAGRGAWAEAAGLSDARAGDAARDRGPWRAAAGDEGLGLISFA
jgi:ureidoglycolate lyase